MFLFLATKLGHLLLQIVVVSDDGFFLTLESLVTFVVLPLDLRGLERQLGGLFPGPVDVDCHVVDLRSCQLVVIEHLRVLCSLALRCSHVGVELDFKLAVEGVDLLDKVHLHSFCFFEVLIAGLLLLGEEVVLKKSQLMKFFLLDCLDHLAQLLGLSIVGARDVVLL